MSGPVEIWFLLHNEDMQAKRVKVDADAVVSDISDAISNKLLRDFGFSAERLITLKLWKPKQKLPIVEETRKEGASDILKGWLGDDVNGLSRVATPLDPYIPLETLLDNGDEQGDDGVMLGSAQTPPTRTQNAGGSGTRLVHVIAQLNPPLMTTSQLENGTA
ncbi:hypothetical protein WOLCODRAFT_152842 [Wolfiporia cocos MD-104 SS10]|uniref:Uncharacterized protein n=1 Tax=Wolfiporia cocos (strain MD-104) TaxID=742152 RepID=A0A2H3K303_WOLCO|nr:hypothetical protein WOLCODRAFT_152842 [Wolfiporia cocos MD-104 SS10]